MRLVTLYWPIQDPAQILPFDHASGPSSAVGNSSSVVVDSTGARAYLLAESSLAVAVHDKSLDVTYATQCHVLVVSALRLISLFKCYDNEHLRFLILHFSQTEKNSETPLHFFP